MEKQQKAKIRLEFTGISLLIGGDTYQIKEELKKQGFWWNSGIKRWVKTVNTKEEILSVMKELEKIAEVQWIGQPIKEEEKIEIDKILSSLQDKEVVKILEPRIDHVEYIRRLEDGKEPRILTIIKPQVQSWNGKSFFLNNFYLYENDKKNFVLIDLSGKYTNGIKVYVIKDNEEKIDEFMHKFENFITKELPEKYKGKLEVENNEYILWLDNSFVPGKIITEEIEDIHLDLLIAGGGYHIQQPHLLISKDSISEIIRKFILNRYKIKEEKVIELD